MSYPEPVSYSSLKDLKKGKGHGGGGVPPPPPSSYAQFYDVEPAQTSSWRQQNPAPSRPVAVNPTKYVDPSKRKEGQDAPTYHRKVAEGDGKDQQPAQGGVWNNVTNTASQGWDNVNDANRRDQVLGGIGHGAAKVAGGAIKMVGKGIWAVGKAATR